MCKYLHSTSLFFPDPENIAVYKHSTDNWQIKINEDSWTLFENQIIPKEAKEFLELPLQDLIELGILIKIDTGYTTLKSFFKIQSDS